MLCKWKRIVNCFKTFSIWSVETVKNSLLFAKHHWQEYIYPIYILYIDINKYFDYKETNFCDVPIFYLIIKSRNLNICKYTHCLAEVQRQEICNLFRFFEGVESCQHPASKICGDSQFERFQQTGNNATRCIAASLILRKIISSSRIKLMHFMKPANLDKYFYIWHRGFRPIACYARLPPLIFC